MKVKGRAWVFGDHIDTDQIIPARYLNTSDPGELASHVMEDADPEFPSKVKRGDIIVGGRNFGCGSSREHAPVAIKYAGVPVVIARSFARIFYRNAFNIGLPLLEVPDIDVNTGDELEVDLENGRIINLTTGRQFQATPVPEFMMRVLKSGGLMGYLKEKMSGWGV